jgi:hypothetical protein
MVTVTVRTFALTACLAALVQLGGLAQRPAIDVTPLPAAVRATSGTTVAVRLSVRLPPDIHLQSDKPRDPSLIPTALTLTPPAGVSVEKIVYPKAVDLTQAGRAEPLSVFSGDLTVEARLAVPSTLPPGEHSVAATFRYQACSRTVCFPPARTTVQWTLSVSAP